MSRSQGHYLLFLDGEMLGAFEPFDEIDERGGRKVLYIFVLQQLVFQVLGRRHPGGKEKIPGAVNRNLRFW